MKTLMIIGAAEEHCIGIRTAQKLGHRVFAIDGNTSAVGLHVADASAVVSTYDAEKALAAAEVHIAGGGRIDGVMTLASDVPFTVAYVAEHLGLPGIGTTSAKLASEKMLMKDRFLEHDVPMPAYQEVFGADDLVGFVEKHGMPVVVKPVDSRGARGVQLIRSSEELPGSYEVAREYSPTGRVMVEAYLPGPQLSTEGFMIDGIAHIPSIFDRNYERLEMYAPFIVEDGGEMPSIYSDDFREEVNQVMQQAALALGIKTGVIKGDLVIHEGRVKVIELAARLSGGFFGTLAAPVSNGVDLVAANINIALGIQLTEADLKPSHQRGSAIRFAFPPVGMIKGIHGLDGVKADPACRYAHVFAKSGESIAPITNHPARPAVVVAEGGTVAEAVGHAQRLISAIEWEMN
jgi:biotin carboxylase